MSPTATRGMAALALLLALPPFAGGQAAPPGATTAPAAAYLYTAAANAFADRTAEAGSEAAGDVAVPGATGDHLIVGFGEPFDRLRLVLAAAGLSGAVAWEFQAADGWRALGPTDASQGMRAVGDRTVAFPPPSTWIRAGVEGYSSAPSLYYVRARVTAAYTTAPILSQVGLEAWTNPARAHVYEAAAWKALDRLTTDNFQDVGAAGPLAVAVGARGLLARSTDGGETWARVPSGTLSDLRGVDVLDATAAIVVGEDGTVLRTSNGGQSWNSVSSGTDRPLEDVEFVTSSVVVAVGDERFLRSTDGGATWTAKNETDAHLKAVSFPDSSRGYAVGDRITAAVFYKTDDGGQTWTNFWDLTYIAFFPDLKFIKDVHFWTPDYGWIVADGQLARTRDAGNIFDTFVRPNLFPKAVRFASASEGWAVGDSGYIDHIRFGDGTDVNITAESQEATRFLKGVAATGPGAALVVGDAGDIFRTAEGAGVWTQPSYAGSKDLFRLDRLPGGTLWASGADGLVLRSRDGGANWTRIPSNSTAALRAVDFVSDTVGWVVGAAGTMNRTDDAGQRWTRQTVPGVPSLTGAHFATDRKGWAVGAVGVTLRTTDGGATWVQRLVDQNPNLNDVHFEGESNGWAVGDNGGVFRTQDGGASWEARTSGTGVALRAVHFGSATRGWAVGAAGTIRSTPDAGASWTNQSLPADAGGLSDVFAVDATTAWAVGEGGQVFKTSNAGADWGRVNAPTTSELLGVVGTVEGKAWAVGRGGTALRTVPEWTDVTNAAANPAENDVRLAGSLTAGDALYVGQATPFDAVALRVNTPAGGGRVAWEYWDGAAWAALSAADASSGFSQSGLRIVKYPLPAAWQPTQLRGDAQAHYYVRARFDASPASGAPTLSEIGTLRLLEPYTGPGGPPTTGPPPPPPPTTRPSFNLTAEPPSIDFGDLQRGAAASREVTFSAAQGQGAVRFALTGSAAAWFQPSPTATTVTPGSPQRLRVDVRIPADAPPGPATVLLLAQVAAAGAGEATAATVPLRVVVETADLVWVRYDAIASLWQAHFGNYLRQDLLVRFQATIRPVGAAAESLPAFERAYPAGTNATVEAVLDTAARPRGAYELTVTAAFNGSTSERRLTIFLGGPPVEITQLRARVVGLGRVEFEFTVRNLVDAPVPARPHVDILNATGWVATVEADVVEVPVGASRQLRVAWEPDAGSFQASATALVDNGEAPAPLVTDFSVEGRRFDPYGLVKRNALWIGAGAVLVVNVLVGVGLWTGRRAGPRI